MKFESKREQKRRFWQRFCQTPVLAAFLPERRTLVVAGETQGEAVRVCIACLWCC